MVHGPSGLRTEIYHRDLLYHKPHSISSCYFDFREDFELRFPARPAVNRNSAPVIINRFEMDRSAIPTERFRLQLRSPAVNSKDYDRHSRPVNQYDILNHIPPWQHHLPAAACAFQAEIRSCSENLPFIAAAGMFFLQPYDIAHLAGRHFLCVLHLTDPPLPVPGPFRCCPESEGPPYCPSVSALC